MIAWPELTFEGLWYLGLLCVFVLGIVAFAGITQWAEKRWPALSRWLDRHTGQPGPWG